MVSGAYTDHKKAILHLHHPVVAQNQGDLASWECIWGLGLRKLQAAAYHPVSPISNNMPPHPLQSSSSVTTVESLVPPLSGTYSPPHSSIFLTSPLDIVPCSGIGNISTSHRYISNSFTCKNTHCNELLV